MRSQKLFTVQVLTVALESFMLGWSIDRALWIGVVVSLIGVIICAVLVVKTVTQALQDLQRYGALKEHNDGPTAH